MQRLVVSSTRAIRTTLERRLEVLKTSELLAAQRLEEMENGSDYLDEFYDMNGQELLDELLKSRVSALKNESSQVEALLDAAAGVNRTDLMQRQEALIRIGFTSSRPRKMNLT